MILINDELQAKMYKRDPLSQTLEAGNMLNVCTWFQYSFWIRLYHQQDVDVTMIAPKGPGHTVRSEYQAGKGVPCLGCCTSGCNRKST